MSGKPRWFINSRVDLVKRLISIILPSSTFCTSHFDCVASHTIAKNDGLALLSYND